MSDQEAVAYIEEWDVTEAAKVLKWYEEYELLRPCDCDAMVAIETEDLKAENAKLRDLALNCYRMAKVHCTDRDCYARCSHWPECYERDTIEHVEPCELSVIAQELGIEVQE